MDNRWLGLVDDERSRVNAGSFNGLVWFLVIQAVLGWFDYEARSDSVVTLVVNTEECIFGLGEVSRDIKVDTKIAVNS